MEPLTSISNVLQIELLDSLKSSSFFSIMADESTGTASEEMISICLLASQQQACRTYLGIVHVKATYAEAITEYLMFFCIPSVITIGNMHMVLVCLYHIWS